MNKAIDLAMETLRGDIQGLGLAGPGYGRANLGDECICRLTLGVTAKDGSYVALVHVEVRPPLEPVVKYRRVTAPAPKCSI
jgi:hypothetical protein